MAKRNNSATKKKTVKKTPQKSSNKGVLIAVLIIVVVLLLGALYTLKETKLKRNEVAQTSNPVVPQKKSIAKPITKATPQTTQSKKTAPVEKQKKPVNTVNVTVNDDVPEYTHKDNYYFKSSFDFMWPAYTIDDQIVEHTAYTLKYNEDKEQADWVAYKLTISDLKSKKAKRTDDYREDPNVLSGSASLEDYRNSGYDRGHLMPAGDAKRNRDIMSETFYLSNMSPQVHAFNDGIWRLLEEKTRSWTYRFYELYIVTGPLYKNKKKPIGKNKVAVPSHFYKVILDIRDPEIKGIGFIIENKDLKDHDFMKYATSIDKVEKATGLDFFPSLPKDIEKTVEHSYDVSLWK